jgi:hypothetical protein
MRDMKNEDQLRDKEKLIRKSSHVTTPPRMEGAVKNKMMNPVKKKKKKDIK